MALKPFRILSSPSRALKGRGSKGLRSNASWKLAGGFVYFAKRYRQIYERITMSSPLEKNRISNAPTPSELSQVLLELMSYYQIMYYYEVQLPEIRNQAK